MNRTEKMDYLIQCLMREMPQYSGRKRPASDAQKWTLLRSLMNLRQPGPADDEFMRIQDALLTESGSEKGIVDANALPALPGHDRLSLWQGDLTTLNIDAIVNAANSAMLGCFQPCHSCIDNAIHTQAGIQLRNECHEIMLEQGHAEPAGTAKITKGYNLPATHVLHTVGPMISGSIVTREDERLLASCYRSCLVLAVRKGLTSIAFCCISTGVFGFPKNRAARIAHDTVCEFLASDTQVERVVFCVFTDEDMLIYQAVLPI